MTDICPATRSRSARSPQRGRTAAKTITRRADGTLHKRDYDNVTYWSLIALDRTKARNAGSGDGGARPRRGRTPPPHMADGAARPGGDARPDDRHRRAREPGHNPKRRAGGCGRGRRSRREHAVRGAARLAAGRLRRHRSAATGSAPATACPRRPPGSATIMLPPEFAGVECVGAATSSSGSRGRRSRDCRCSSCSTRSTSWPGCAAGASPPSAPGCRSTRPCCRPASRSTRRGRRFIGMDDPVPEAQWAFVLPGASEPRQPRRRPL